MTTPHDSLNTGGIRERAGRWSLWAPLVLLAIVFAVRFPAIVQPMGPDQGVYATIGWALQHDMALYRDLFEQKPPGIYLTYLLGFKLFGNDVNSIFWIDYLASALTVAAVFGIGRRLVNVRFGALAAAVVAIGTLPAARHGYGGFLERAVTETFIIPLAAWAALAAVTFVAGERTRWAFAAGLLVGVASVFKQTALIYWPAFALWTWIVAGRAPAIRFVIWSTAGVVIAPTVAIAWLWTTGVLADAWLALVEYNLAYLALGDQGVGFTLRRFMQEVWQRVKSDEVWAIGGLSAVVAVCAWRWRTTPVGRFAALCVIWLAAALTATVANGPRLFTTYFLPSLVPLSLLATWLLYQTLASGRRRLVAAGLVVLALAGLMAVRSGSLRRAANATTWDAGHFFGRMDQQQYLSRFRSRSTPPPFSAADNARLADYIRAQTQPSDRIFVFGMTAGTYFSSQRLPASRFLWAYAAVSNMANRPEFRVETLAAELARTAPAYIVLQRTNGDSFSGWRAAEAFKAPPLQALIESAYREEIEIGDFVLYRRNADAPPWTP